MTLDTTFDPAAIEQRWYAHWEETGQFRPARDDAEPFTIVNPPPNVTGSLHIGHALDNTLQDIIIRHERLKGKDALWVVGTDHAGIATQMVVERQLAEEQKKRTDFTREEFVDKVWEWKAESGGTITRQLRRLGCSMDWSNERFTMDEGFTRAVTKVFVDLYNQGLIYRDKRLVNWDPKLKTAISDLEVENVEQNGHFWHFRYPLADGATTADGKDHIVVATTRPETMLADMAAAVHPSDERYAALIENGARVVLPITGRVIPIVADEHADPELGSGAVKITPGHDFNDFEVGKRAGIKPADMLNMLDGDANVVNTADGLVPEELIGMDRFDARKAVVAMLKEQGLLIPHIAKTKKGEEIEQDAEPRKIMTPLGDRSNVVIEPWLTDQWYVDAETLAQPAIKAVRDGSIEIVPKSWEKTYFNWMENIQPWCISRQLWWGHRIPVWYGPNPEDREARWKMGHLHPDEERVFFENPHVFVAESEDEVRQAAAELYGIPADEIAFADTLKEAVVSSITPLSGGPLTLYRDEDVLDTWFSSALWPFATIGWPEETTDLKRHYPNDLLISGFDILFFWDARMAMQGIQFMGEVPWRRLYLHGLVRAADGSKMSKSKGNTVDPLGLIEQYGADALRFFMAAMESQGRDIKMDEKRVEGYRNFATKLWNAARFCQSNGIAASTSLAAPQATLPVNRWIIGEVVETLQTLDKALADLRFDAAANTIYQFTWSRFCDWYLELIKPLLQGEGGADADETRAVAGWVLDQIFVMLHPFMPFITEELWHAMASDDALRGYDLITAKWPSPRAAIDADAKGEIDWIIGFTTAMRSAKNELGIAPGAKLDCWFPTSLEPRVTALQSTLERVARIGAAQFGEAPTGASMQLVVEGETITVPLEGVIDIEAEKSRLSKALEAVSKEAKSLEGRLGNANFVERAKPEAVEKARADHAEKSAEAERLTAALARLG
ncbi:valine--tRNA ligase [Alterisphingorhabdus coralli]|uniref:Valine--tRNA ligase n=1 Tax=Alterisphingorhabdus coralli TaxID=3071408 RepID=A0AA97F713_9SPHN|nr:valine--tRNA ligase [Parasphingorhabdus sp. SCSIO 66989]WOE75584.1 valine--tRNA ligase [Parasphingorhabdus sp. SCSIO 66989]